MGDFAGVDIVAERHIDDATLRQVLAEVLLVPVDRVVIIVDMASYPPAQMADAVCVRSPVLGEFAEVLSINCNRLGVPEASVLEIVGIVAVRLQMRLLMPDDSHDPFAMWLLSPDGKRERVGLDPVALDQDRYEIEHSRSPSAP